MTTPLPPPIGTAVDLECAWLSGDPAVTAYLPGGVLPWMRTRAEGVKVAELRLERTEERREANGRSEIIHQVILRVSWPTANAASSSADDQAYLHGACTALRARIRGVPGDHTHGGAFASAGDTADGNARGIDVTYEDPLRTPTEGNPVLLAVIRYGLTENLLTA